jgi:hypothetical protein
MKNLQNAYYIKGEGTMMEGPAWVKLRTYNGIPFQYRRMENGDLEIEYGSLPFKATIAQEIFKEMLELYRGKTLLLGAAYDDPPPRSLGEWLIEKLHGRNLAIYVGTILVNEEYAHWGKDKEGVCLHFKKLTQ